MDLVEEVYGLTKAFPRHEAYGLAGQLQRAAVSIPSNIAEGYARQYRKEYIQHLAIAQASLAELDTQLEIAARLRYISSEQLLNAGGHVASLGRQLYALRQSLSKTSAEQ